METVDVDDGRIEVVEVLDTACEVVATLEEEKVEGELVLVAGKEEVVGPTIPPILDRYR